MSWLFSQALVAAFLPESCSDGELSAQSNGSHTQLAYLPPDRMTAFSRLSRYGMTFRPLTADRGEELLMSYLAAFRARTSALPERVQALQASAAECGDTWRGSLARFDPDTSSWKTVQRSLLEDSESCSVIWPRSGMTANGQCWELPTLGHRTSATDSGLWQTPVADDAVNRVNGKINSRGEPKLSAQVLRWPTPTVCGNYNRKGASAKSGDGLETAVQKWPTPTARCHKGGGEFHDTQGWEESLRHARLGGGVPDWYATEPDVGRVADGVAARVDRLKALGNGQVPLCAATAWRLLTS
jgi:hypothetical protein